MKLHVLGTIREEKSRVMVGYILLDSETNSLRLVNKEKLIQTIKNKNIHIDNIKVQGETIKGIKYSLSDLPYVLTTQMNKVYNVYKSIAISQTSTTVTLATIDERCGLRVANYSKCDIPNLLIRIDILNINSNGDIMCEDSEGELERLHREAMDSELEWDMASFLKYMKLRQWEVEINGSNLYTSDSRITLLHIPRGIKHVNLGNIGNLEKLIVSKDTIHVCSVNDEGAYINGLNAKYDNSIDWKSCNILKELVIQNNKSLDITYLYGYYIVKPIEFSKLDKLTGLNHCNFEVANSRLDVRHMHSAFCNSFIRNKQLKICNNMEIILGDCLSGTRGIEKIEIEATDYVDMARSLNSNESLSSISILGGLTSSESIQNKELALESSIRDNAELTDLSINMTNIATIKNSVLNCKSLKEIDLSKSHSKYIDTIGVGCGALEIIKLPIVDRASYPIGSQGTVIEYNKEQYHFSGEIFRKMDKNNIPNIRLAGPLKKLSYGGLVWTHKSLDELDCIKDLEKLGTCAFSGYKRSNYTYDSAWTPKIHKIEANTFVNDFETNKIILRENIEEIETNAIKGIVDLKYMILHKDIVVNPRAIVPRDEVFKIYVIKGSAAEKRLKNLKGIILRTVDSIEEAIEIEEGTIAETDERVKNKYTFLLHGDKDSQELFADKYKKNIDFLYGLKVDLDEKEELQRINKMADVEVMEKYPEYFKDDIPTLNIDIMQLPNIQQKIKESANPDLIHGGELVFRLLLTYYNSLLPSNKSVENPTFIRNLNNLELGTVGGFYRDDRRFIGRLLVRGGILGDTWLILIIAIKDNKVLYLNLFRNEANNDRLNSVLTYNLHPFGEVTLVNLNRALDIMKDDSFEFYSESINNVELTHNINRNFERTLVSEYKILGLKKYEMYGKSRSSWKSYKDTGLLYSLTRREIIEAELVVHMATKVDRIVGIKVINRYSLAELPSLLKERSELQELRELLNTESFINNLLLSDEDIAKFRADISNYDKPEDDEILSLVEKSKTLSKKELYRAIINSSLYKPVKYSLYTVNEGKLSEIYHKTRVESFGDEVLLQWSTDEELVSRVKGGDKYELRKTTKRKVMVDRVIVGLLPMATKAKEQDVLRAGLLTIEQVENIINTIRNYREIYSNHTVTPLYMRYGYDKNVAQRIIIISVIKFNYLGKDIVLGVDKYYGEFIIGVMQPDSNDICIMFRFKRVSEAIAFFREEILTYDLMMYEMIKLADANISSYRGSWVLDVAKEVLKGYPKQVAYTTKTEVDILDKLKRQPVLR